MEQKNKVVVAVYLSHAGEACAAVYGRVIPCLGHEI